jgi:hypothetical protein
MSANELLSYYESTVTFDTEILEQDNPAIREYVTELRGALEHRAILRMLRLQADIPVCCGDGHCITQPTAKCMKNKHQTCPEHTESCYLCHRDSGE